MERNWSSLQFICLPIKEVNNYEILEIDWILDVIKKIENEINDSNVKVKRELKS